MTYIKKYKYIILGAVIVAIAFGTYGSGNTSPSDTTKQFAKTVEYIRIADLLNESHITESVGQIDSKQSVDLKSQINGTIESVHARIGDRVYKGQTIARFSNADSYASVAQAEAGVSIQEARLSELVGGSRTEELAVAKSTVANAVSSVGTAETALREVLRTAYRTADDTIRYKTDILFSNPRTNPQLIFSPNNFALVNRLEQSRAALEDMLVLWEEKTSHLDSVDTFDTDVAMSQSYLAVVATFFDDMATAVNSLQESSEFSATTIANYRAAVSGVRTSISGQVSAVIAADQSLSSAHTALSQAEQQLRIKETGGTSDQIKAQQALLDQAKANLLSAQAQYAKTIVTSPISGEIASLPIKVGQYVGVNQTLVKIINKDNLYIQAFINTDDVPFVRAGDSATIAGLGQGVVRVVSSGIDPSNGKIEVQISLPTNLTKPLIEG